MKKYETLLTIILITKDRFDFINRLLSYYDFINLKSNIIIADSTEFEKNNLDKFYYKNYKNLSIEFFSRPNIRPENLQLEMLKKVSTKYTIVCADDDIILENSIIKCIDFLETNSDYISATGRIHGFASKKDKSKNCKIYVWDEYSQKNITQNNPNKRLKNYLSNYWVNFFSITRTAEYIKSSSYSHLSQSSALRGEVIPCMSLALIGKTKKLDHLHMVRQFFLEKKHYPLISVLEYSIKNSGWSDEIINLRKDLNEGIPDNFMESKKNFDSHLNSGLYYFMRNEVLIYNKKVIVEYLYAYIFNKGKVKAILNKTINLYKKLRGFFIFYKKRKKNFYLKDEKEFLRLKDFLKFED